MHTSQVKAARRRTSAVPTTLLHQICTMESVIGGCLGEERVLSSSSGNMATRARQMEAAGIESLLVLTKTPTPPPHQRIAIYDPKWRLLHRHTA